LHGKQRPDAPALFELLFDVGDEFFTLGVDGILSVEEFSSPGIP